MNYTRSYPTRSYTNSSFQTDANHFFQRTDQGLIIAFDVMLLKSSRIILKLLFATSSHEVEAKMTPNSYGTKTPSLLQYVRNVFWYLGIATHHESGLNDGKE